MKVLVCGGRDFSDRDWLRVVLAKLHAHRGPFTLVIQGGATGADCEAAVWARSVEPPISVRTYPALWYLHGRAARPKRNQQMLDEGAPDLVVAFPGWRGTAD